MRENNYVRRTRPGASITSGDYLATSALSYVLYQYCRTLTGNTLDVGCGERPYITWLTQIQTYTGFDITESQTKPNVIGISEHLPFASEYFDSVLCTQVLEHVARPWLALQEIGRVLRKDGLLLLSAPKSWRLHEEPYDYYRYTKYGLSFLLQQSNLQIIHMKPQGGVWTNIGASIINTVWRKPARKYWPTWLIRMVFTVALNATFASADRIWLDEDDTYNYVVLAKKVSLPK